MSILVSCSGCGQAFQTRDANAGRVAECPDCGKELLVPKAPGTAYDLPDASSPVGGFTSGRAIASLVLGLFSMGCMFFAGIPAIVLGVLAIRDINQSRGRVRGGVLATVGIMFGLLGSSLISWLFLYPMVQSARESAGRAACVNNYKQIGLALHNFHNAHGRFPPAAITNKQGQPLLSWRVAILPYLGTEGEALYRQFNLNEPWDGPTNSRLLAKMPSVFACPSDPPGRGGHTRCLAFVGPTGIFTGGKKGVAIHEILDGTTHTILVEEADLAKMAYWTAPDDLSFNPTLPLGGMGSNHQGGAHMLMADGSVHFVHDTVGAPVSAALISKAGGEVVSIPR